MEVYNGAPAESRSDVENRVYAALAQLELPFTRVDHEPAFTMEDCAAISEIVRAVEKATAPTDGPTDPHCSDETLTLPDLVGWDN